MLDFSEASQNMLLGIFSAYPDLFETWLSEIFGTRAQRGIGKEGIVEVIYQTRGRVFHHISTHREES